MKSDVVIIGGGPGGATCAMFLAAAGIKATIIEKETFPRYHIGESMTGECGNVVRDLGLEAEMIRRRHPVKHGVRVFSPKGKHTFSVPVRGRAADGSMFDASTWQVRRSDFDAMLLDEATSRGADLIHGTAIAPLRGDDGAVTGVRLRLADGAEHDLHSEVLVDASGQLTFLARQGVTGTKLRGNYDKQIAVFSQVANAYRDEGTQRNDTLIFYQSTHHWAWFIPIDDEIVSVGVVIPGEEFLSKHESRHDFLVREIQEINPELKRRVPDLRLVEEARAIPNYSYEAKSFTGKGFICIGDAHRFIDPIFSFGLFVTVKEAQFAAGAIARYFAGEGRDAPNPFAEHERLCQRGTDAYQELIDGFWEDPLAFQFLVHHKYTDDVIDLFAGRVYAETPSPGLQAMRALNERRRQRNPGSIPAPVPHISVS